VNWPGAKTRAEGAEMRKTGAGWPQSKQRRGLALGEPDGTKCGKSAEGLRKLSTLSEPSQSAAPVSIPCAEPGPPKPAKQRRCVPTVADRTPGDDLAPALVPVHTPKNAARSFTRAAPRAAGCAAAPMTPHEAAVIAAAMAILDARLRATGLALHSLGDLKSLLRLHLAERDREVFAVMFFDAHHRLIAFEVLFEGTLTQTTVYPRELVRRALEHNAAAVVLSHNHPSGDAEPSRADEFLTQTIKTALALVDVCVLDHVIVAGADSVSLYELGML
jgi:DNA repair protein RadC